MTNYRFKDSIFWTGLVCTPLFATIGVASVVAVVMNADGSFPKPIVIPVLFFGLFWGSWTLLGAWLMVAYWRTRLLVSSDGVGLVGVTRTKMILLDKVTEARWRRWPKGGSLVLRDSQTRLVITFEDYPRVYRAELLAAFRDSIPKDVQRDWDRFPLEFHDPKRRPATPREKFWRFVTGCCFVLGFGGLLWWAVQVRAVPPRQVLGLAVADIVSAAWVVWRGVRECHRLAKEKAVE